MSEGARREQPHITLRTVDVHIARLRQKLEAAPQIPQHILTVRGKGYPFEMWGARGAPP